MVERPAIPSMAMARTTASMREMAPETQFTAATGTITWSAVMMRPMSSMAMPVMIACTGKVAMMTCMARQEMMSSQAAMAPIPCSVKTIPMI